MRKNLTLENGLQVYNLRARQGTSLVTLFITDLENDTRVMIDLESKRVLSGGIALSSVDFEGVSSLLLESEKSGQNVPSDEKKASKSKKVKKETASA